MKGVFPVLLTISLAGASASGESGGYTNFIRQTVLETSPPLYWDVSVPSAGERLSLVAIDLAGSRYELWTVKTGSSPKSYLLDTAYVSAYAPEAEITIQTEDDHAGAVPRTRVDRPFQVKISVNGLRNGPLDPVASKSVRLLRHVQSYGETDGSNIDRSQALLESQAVIDRNGMTLLSYPMSAIPGPVPARIRGEERFSIFTRNNDGTDDQQLASRRVQIWPLAEASIEGIEQDQTLRFKVPTLTVRVENLYPTSYTYTQLYKGAPALGTEGRVIPSAQLQIDGLVPESRVWTSASYGELFDEDGQWTLEVVTDTVFGSERLAYVTFHVDRSLTVNGMVTTSEES